MNERRKVNIVAKLGAFLSAFCLISLAVIYLRYRHAFAIAIERHPDIYWLVVGFLILGFVVCPAVCVRLLMISWRVLYYLKKECRELKCNKSDDNSAT